MEKTEPLRLVKLDSNVVQSVKENLIDPFGDGFARTKEIVSPYDSVAQAKLTP